MRIEARDTNRHYVGRLTVDSTARPTRSPLEGEQGEVFLNWDSALDDAGHLRRCVVCGCPDLFQEKAFPQVTMIIVVLAFLGAFAGTFAGIFATEINLPLMVALVIVLVLDVGVLVFARRRLVCYRCRSSFHGVTIARYHQRWDRAVADRYPAPTETPEEGIASSAESPAAGVEASRNADAARASVREGAARG